MGTPLDDLPAINDQHLIGMANRAQSVGDDEARSAFQQGFQCFLNFPFSSGVHAAGSLVHDEDSGIDEGDTGDRDQLSLTLTEPGSALAKSRLITIRQSTDEFIGMGQPGSGYDFFFGRIRSPVSDIVHHGVAKQERVLQHDADLPSKTLLGHGSNIDAINNDTASRHIPESRQQVDDRRLSGPGRSHDGDCLAGLGIN